MGKIKLRGLKLLEGGAQVASFSPFGKNGLAAGICSSLAVNEINLTFLTHVCPDEIAGSSVNFCTEGTAGRAASSIIEARAGGSAEVGLREDVSIISIFPHGRQPRVTGELLKALGKKDIPLRGLASSPSAISSVVSSAHTEIAFEALFGAFEFPTYRSPSDWYAAYEGKERLLKKIIASYQEKVIRIYDIVHQTDLELLSLVLPASQTGRVGASLNALGHLGFKMPFIVAMPLKEPAMRFSFCLFSDRAEDVSGHLSRELSAPSLTCRSPVAALFIHGPHFGDRYGIAHTLIEALKRAGVPLLAVGCTVSSISAIIHEKDLAKALGALDRTFQRSSKNT